MANYPQNRLHYTSVNNGYAPQEAEGPRSVDIDLDFSTEASWYVDLGSFQSEGKIGQIQSIYVDNSANPAALTIVVSGTGQRLVIPALADVVQPIFSPQGFQGTFTTTPGANVLVKLQLLNVPLAPSQMGPVTVNATFGAITGTYTDRSVAGTGADQAVMAANPLRKGLVLQAASANLGSYWISFTGAATGAPPDIELTPGSFLPPQLAISTQAIRGFSAGGNNLIAKELL